MTKRKGREIPIAKTEFDASEREIIRQIAVHFQITEDEVLAYLTSCRIDDLLAQVGTIKDKDMRILH